MAITPFKGVEGKGINAEMCIFYVQPMPTQLGKLRTTPSNQTTNKRKSKRKRK